MKKLWLSIYARGARGRNENEFSYGLKEEFVITALLWRIIGFVYSPLIQLAATTTAWIFKFFYEPWYSKALEAVCKFEKSPWAEAALDVACELGLPAAPKRSRVIGLRSHWHLRLILFFCFALLAMSKITWETNMMKRYFSRCESSLATFSIISENFKKQ